MNIPFRFSLARILPLGSLAAFSVLLSPSSDAAFTGLGFISEEAEYSDAYAISADGSTVVGFSAYVGADDQVYPASFKWTAAGGMVELPKSSPDVIASYGYGVSGDGSVIVGLELLPGNTTRAYRYENGAIELLPTLPSSSVGVAEGVSGDGSVVVGFGFDAFRWTAVGGTVPLPLLADEVSSTANAISYDGSTIVGTSNLADGGLRAFRWTEAGGVQTISIPGAEESAAHAASADGSTIVGAFLNQANQDTAFAWTELGVVVLSSLSLEEGMTLNRAYAVSGDGMWAGGESGKRAVVWNALTGEVIDLKAFLEANGYAGLEGWELSAVLGMSADGLSMTGVGLNPEGTPEAWHLSLTTPIPEPFSVGLLVLGSGGLLFRRRRIA